MNRSGKSCKVISATGFLVLLLFGFAGQTFADTKPKFVYVANTGAGAADSFQTFKVSAVALCPNFSCFSVDITGTFTLNKNLGVATSASSITLLDTAELPAPLVLPLGVQQQIGSNVALIFGQFSNGAFTGPTVTLVFPGTTSGGIFPSAYSGGKLCFSPLASGCGAASVAQFTDNSGAVTATFINGDVTTTATPPIPPGPGGVWGYAIDGTSGALTVIPGSPFAVGIDPHSVAVDPSNRFVYVANATSNNISAFAVDTTTGVLAPVAGSPFAAGLNPFSVAVDPSDRFVYVANQVSNDVSAYTLDKTTGALTPMSGSPFPAGTGPIFVTMDPLGRFAYVTNGTPVGQESISEYSIDATTGALKPVNGSPLVNGQATVNTPTATLVDPTGKFLYEYFENKSGAVLSYAIDAATGALTEFASPSGPNQPLAAAVDPTGGFVYQATSNGSVSGYSINSTTGALTGMSMPGVTAGGGLPPVSMAIDPSSSFAYVANSSGNNIYEFTINSATRAWTAIPGSPLTTGAGPSSLAIVGSSSAALESFKARVDIDEDRRTSFRVEGSFQLPQGSAAIDPVTQTMELQVGTYLVTIPAGSFRKQGGHDSDGDRDRDRDWGRHGFVFTGEINDVDLNVRIQTTKDSGYRFTAEGRGKILQGITNPVTVGLTIGNFEGSLMVKADIDK